MTYIDTVRTHLAAELPDVQDELIDLYALLALTQGQRTSMQDVHDAWAVWRSRIRPDHPDLVPFKDLAPSIQELDRKYLAAVLHVVFRLDLR